MVLAALVHNIGFFLYRTHTHILTFGKNESYWPSPIYIYECIKNKKVFWLVSIIEYERSLLSIDFNY